jgi:hypothetical protein
MDVAAPQVGDWYRRLDKGEPFQVISVDDESGSIEIQSFDGELDSIDVEEWSQLALAPAPPPEDWSGALDDVEPDDVTEDDSSSDRSMQ